MKALKTKSLPLWLLAALLAFACSVPSLVPTPAPLPSATPTWTLLPQDNPPLPTETPSPTDTDEDSGQPATPSSTPGSTQEAFNCPNAPAARVKVGDRARVTFTDGLALRVRKEPEVADNVVIQIPEGTEFDIIGGPVCAPIPDTGGSYVFWLISIRQGSTTGWVAEGDTSDYFIESVD